MVYGMFHSYLCSMAAFTLMPQCLDDDDDGLDGVIDQFLVTAHSILLEHDFHFQNDRATASDLCCFMMNCDGNRSGALRDRRFPPIQAKELPYLECTVSILTDYESALHYLDWEIGKHGLIIEFTDPDYSTRCSATYLPEVAAHEGWTKTETIDSLMRKAGYNGLITESLRRRLHVTRYQSTLYTMHYSDYATHVKMTRGTVPIINGARLNF